jgi:hypothetical protein
METGTKPLIHLENVKKVFYTDEVDAIARSASSSRRST